MSSKTTDKNAFTAGSVNAQAICAAEPSELARLLATFAEYNRITRDSLQHLNGMLIPIMEPIPSKETGTDQKAASLQTQLNGELYSELKFMRDNNLHLQGIIDSIRLL